MALAIGTFAKAVEASPSATFTQATSEKISVAFDTPFITATGGSQYAAKPRSIGQPINTIKCDNRSAVIVPTLVRVAHGSIDKFRSEEHTSELQSLIRISYAVLCLKKKTT